MTPFRVYTTAELGRDGYPRAWHDLGDGRGVKHLVREQAGYRCARCRHPYPPGAGEWSACDDECRHAFDDETTRNVFDETGEGTTQARWRILTVHHLNGDKADLRWWNLAPLCQRCHLAIQGKVDMRRVYPWPHSDWFRPYAAGWYAAAYLGLDLDRDETIARLDELLALELAPGVAS